MNKLGLRLTLLFSFIVLASCVSKKELRKYHGYYDVDDDYSSYGNYYIHCGWIEILPYIPEHKKFDYYLKLTSSLRKGKQAEVAFFTEGFFQSCHGWSYDYRYYFWTTAGKGYLADLKCKNEKDKLPCSYSAILLTTDETKRLLNYYQAFRGNNQKKGYYDIDCSECQSSGFIGELLLWEKEEVVYYVHTDVCDAPFLIGFDFRANVDSLTSELDVIWEKYQE